MDSKLTSESLPERIKELATRLGIDAIGFTPIGDVTPEVQTDYLAWIESKKHADMTYLERNNNVRFDPEELMQGARSIIVIALSYYPQRLQSSSAPQVSKYAYGKDYHKVMKEILTKLGDMINQEVAEHKYRAIVDTAPFLERYWAVEAGLGFIGKSRNLIIPGKGSFFFLGELLTTMELPKSPHRHYSCGGCRRCIDNCPTRALDEESGLDAQRCISYLTIEHQGDIPQELSTRFGKRLYGCDTCQDVCPFNRKPIPTKHFEAKESILKLSKEDLRHLSETRYGEIFYGSAATRAKYDGMLRNARIYLQNNE